jgi:hypothetical protein
MPLKLTASAPILAAAIVLIWAAPSQSVAPPPTGCTPAQTRHLVSRFVAAFNLGDQRAINATWASKAWFKWYSVTSDPGARTPQDSARRDRLLPYFANRHAAHERLIVTDLKINGVSGGGYRNFEFRLMRSADDLPNGPIAYIGKGASTCSTGRLFVWAMNAAA